MLSEQEKEELYKFIVITIGDDPKIRARKPHFDRVTVDVVEEMINAAMECNHQIRGIFVDIASTGGVLARGWLKTALKASSHALENTQLRGYGCQSKIKSAWGNKIIISTH